MEIAKSCSIEEQLIILCARLEMSGSQEIALDRLIRDKGLSWQKVLRKADWYRISAFLLYHLRRLDCGNTIPTWVMEDLKKLYFRNGYLNLRRRAELRQVLLALAEDDIPAIALKGAALLETVYPNGCLRPMSDVDLLVPEENADAVQSRLMEFGYLPMGSPEQQESQREVHHHLARLVNSKGIGVIEVHSHIVPRDSEFRFNIASFWKHAVPQPVAGVDALILAPEHHLMHLAVHFFLARRFGSRVALSQICDMAETLRHYQHRIDWAFLEEEVLSQGLQGPTGCGLFLAKSLLDAPVQESFLRRTMSDEGPESGLDLFLRRRVLDDRRAVSCQWVKPQAAYNLPNLVSGAFHRIFSDRPADLEPEDKSYEAPALPAIGPVRRVMTGITLLAQFWRRPLDLWQELRVERWIHSVSAEALAGSSSSSEESLQFPEDAIKNANK